MKSCTILIQGCHNPNLTFVGKTLTFLTDKILIPLARPDHFECSELSGGMIYVALLSSQALNKGQQMTYQELPLLHLHCLVSYARGFTRQFMEVIDVLVSTVKCSLTHIIYQYTPTGKKNCHNDTLLTGQKCIYELPLIQLRGSV